MNLQTYMLTKFLRYMVGLLKTSQNLYQNVYAFVPVQNFTYDSDINWLLPVKEIDELLFNKYNLSESEKELIRTSIKDISLSESDSDDDNDNEE